MTKLINADEIMKSIIEQHCKECVLRKGVKNGKLRVIYDIGEAPCRACLIDYTKTIIDDAPAVDAEPVKRGYIKYKTIYGRDRVSCSACGYEYARMDGDIHNYCPNCGAKMGVLGKILPTL